MKHTAYLLSDKYAIECVLSGDLETLQDYINEFKYGFSLSEPIEFADDKAFGKFCNEIAKADGYVGEYSTPNVLILDYSDEADANVIEMFLNV